MQTKVRPPSVGKNTPCHAEENQDFYNKEGEEKWRNGWFMTNWQKGWGYKGFQTLSERESQKGENFTIA